METKNAAVIAAEIKISVTSDTIEEIEMLIRKIQDACKSSDYKLNVALEGDFFKQADHNNEADFFEALFTNACRAYTTPLTEHGKDILDCSSSVTLSTPI